MIDFIRINQIKVNNINCNVIDSALVALPTDTMHLFSNVNSLHASCANIVEPLMPL